MDRDLQFRIEAKDQGKELLAFLREKGFSRNILHAMKADRSNLKLNGVRAYGSGILNYGDVLDVHVPETETCSAIPICLPLDILYEDQDLLAINKPSNMPVHMSMGNYENTLSNAVACYQKEQGEAYPIRCINRLDRDTTGILLIAKNPLSGAILSGDIRDRRIHRTYLAVVEGKTPPSGVIDAPIARVPDSVMLRQVDHTSGEKAVTHYERLDYAAGCSLLRIWLETGRTHQIRVHMKHIGHPLPGDYLYHPVYDQFKRQPLHSSCLEFTHPILREPMKLSAPLPEDMKQLFEGITTEETS